MRELVAATSDSSAFFRLWGAVEAVVDGRAVDMGTQRERCLLVGLLVARSTPVPRDSLHRWIWDDAPESAADDVNKFMTNLRKRLGALGLASALVSRNGLCQLKIAESSVDAYHVKQAVTLASQSADEQAAELLDQALRLCDGEPLAGLATRRVDGYRRQLAADRLAAEIAYYQVELRLGRHHARIGGLTRMFDERPTDNMVTALTMCALFFAGRQSDALDVYRRHRNELVDENGLDVSPELRELHERLLRQELTTDPGRFPLKRARQANGAPAMEDAGTVLIAVRSSIEDQADVRRMTGETFGGARFHPELVDGCVVCAVPADIPAVTVIGVWMSRLSSAVCVPTQVGIALVRDGNVCDLARSDYAGRILDGAPGSKLVVAVSDSLYRSVVMPRGRDVDPAAYRRMEDAGGGWVRIPGMSVPPHPVDDGPLPPPTPAGLPGPSVNFHGNTRIDKQQIGTVFYDYSGRRDE